MLTHRNVLANVTQVQNWIEPFLDKTQRLTSITPIPLYHIYAMSTCFSFVGLGGTNVLVADPRNMTQLIKILRKYPFVSLPGVNTLFQGLVNHPDFAKLNFSTLRVAIGGGAPVQPSVAKKWLSITKSPLVEGYGLTECSPIVTVNPFDVQEFSGSIGLPLPSTEVSIRNADGEQVQLGEAGELCVRGPQVMLGYWRRPEETLAVMTADGYLKTGDMAVMNDGGFIKIVDRIKDMILVSGFNVYPSEVEQVVLMLSEVAEVAAIGVPCATSGERIKIYVVKKVETLTKEAILNHCRANLTAYKMPHQIEFLPELPKSNVGKILRRALRDLTI
jgi:long-chain acyl-CoA synthetase